MNAHLLKFLHKKTKKYDLFISTGTPEKEIIHILKNKKIFNYFKKFSVHPVQKLNILIKLRINTKKEYLLVIAKKIIYHQKKLRHYSS